MLIVILAVAVRDELPQKRTSGIAVSCSPLGGSADLGRF